MLRVEFDDCTSQASDHQPSSRETCTAPLLDPAIFRQVRIDPEVDVGLSPGLVWAIPPVILAASRR